MKNFWYPRSAYQGRHRALEKADLLQSLRHVAHGSLVGLAPGIARRYGSQGGLVRVEHHFVDGPLFRREPPVHGVGAGYVGGVIVILAAGVHQQQVAVLHAPVIGVVMQDAGVGAGPDDGLVRRPAPRGSGTRA